MVSPDLFKEQTSSASSIDGGMHRDEVHALGYTVDNIHNCVIAMGFRQFDYEVNADHVPWCLAHIMVLFNDTAPKVSVIGDIDLTTKHE
jgi:hypothetical protein